MSELDLSKYEGAEKSCALGVVQSRCPRCRVMRDAPLLLSEVKRLRDELSQAREDHHKLGAWTSCSQCTKFYRDDEEAAVQNDRLRQSHTRLLAAIKNDCLTRVTKEGLCWCHMPIRPHGGYCDELRAAVAEAEAL